MPPTPNPNHIQKKHFGYMPNGLAVESYTLCGTHGLTLEVLTYGGIVRRLLVPDREGTLDDVVLGYDTLEAYLKDPFFMGATAGRIAGRIHNGLLKIETKTYQLPINTPPNHLHGGAEALNTKLWIPEILAREDGAPSLKLSYTSPDGEQGYPGKLKISVTYTATNANEFIFETSVESDQVTPVSLTHHSYFNLSGKGNVLDHAVQVHSSQTVKSDETMAHLHQLEPVEGRAADLNQPKPVEDFIDGIWQKHGDLYWLSESSEMKPAARIVDPASGRILEASTTQSCLQTYFGKDFDASIQGKSGITYPQFPGLCIECQGYPEASNVQGMGDILVRPGAPLQHRTIYAFSTE